MNIEIEDLKKVSLKPGEIVVLTYPKLLRSEQREFIANSFAKAFPDNKILVLDGGMSMEVYNGNHPKPMPESGKTHDPQCVRV